MSDGVPVYNSRTAASMRSIIASAMADQKHDHNKDFGFPDQILFDQLYAMWDRNSLAQAMVSRISGTIWRDDPSITLGDDTHEETEQEKAIRKVFEDKRIWSKLAEAYKRSLVGDYAAAIIRVADGRDWREPVGRVSGSVALWDVIPAWEKQIEVSTWELDPRSKNYGSPSMYQFNESSVPDDKTRGATRSFAIHPDRVLIFSTTGDTFGRSVLRSAFNDLITYSKVIGSGGEGFWKAARSSIHMKVDNNARLADLASALGVTVKELPDKLDSVVEDWVKGYDKNLMVQGMDLNSLGVTLPTNPEQYYNGPLQAAAASIDCPSKVLIGNQTGERASSEDNKSWNATCASRRNHEVIPVLRDMLYRFKLWGVLPAGDWSLSWSDLTEATGADKMAGAKIMAEINAASLGLGDTPFSASEIREQAGFEAEMPDDMPPAPPAQLAKPVAPAPSEPAPGAPAPAAPLPKPVAL